MASKRSTYDALGTEELRTLLQAAKGKVARLEQRILEQRRQSECSHDALEKVTPIGPRDNGEFTYICSKCGSTQ
jgi:hypothetical protein